MQSNAFSGLALPRDDDGRQPQHFHPEFPVGSDPMRAVQVNNLPQQQHEQHYAYAMRFPQHPHPFPPHQQHYAYLPQTPVYSGRENGGYGSNESDEDERGGYEHRNQSPGAWSSQTDSSGFSSPPSDGGNEL